MFTRRLWLGVASLGWALSAVLGCGESSSQRPTDGVTHSACTAGASRCDGLNVKVCDADGTSEVIATTCLPAQTCYEGACRDTACVPRSTFCEDGSVWKCDSTGGGRALAAKCAAGTFCRESEGSAWCSDQRCTPLSPLCDGSVATTCLSDGSGPSAGGMDCAQTGEACYLGECRDLSCMPGMRLCHHDDVYLCAQNGTELSLFADCRDDEVCDGDLGTCRAKVCEPGATACNGSRPVTCNSYGSGWLTSLTDCAARSSACVDGACKEIVCTPSTESCEGDDVYACDVTGTVVTRTTSCRAGSHCESSGGGAQCLVNDCVPGEVYCELNVVKTCLDDGKAPDVGVPCDEGEACFGSTCAPLNCELNQNYCDGSWLYFCDLYGPRPLEECPSDHYCQTVPGGAMCSPRLCEPGSVTCLGEKVGTCTSDGLSLAQVTVNCATTSNVCSSDLECVPSTTDTLAVAEEATLVEADFLIADVIDVTATRQMTELAVNLITATPRELRWVVYEDVGGELAAQSDKLVSNVTSAGFVSSGVFNYTLQAGRRYALGVVVRGGDSVAYRDTAPFPRNVSFGALRGNFTGPWASPIAATLISSTTAYQMKVTTRAP